MKIISKLQNYINNPTKCFIPKCNAICCADAPLPETFLPNNKDKIVRNIYGAINIGVNDVINDTFNSVIYKTTPDPIQFIGFDQNGNKIATISKEMIKRLELKSMAEIQALHDEYSKYPNYCPFLTDSGRCDVYEKRPQICQEFGTKIEDPRNICPKKSSRKDIIKYHIVGFYEYYRDLAKSLFKPKSKV